MRRRPLRIQCSWCSSLIPIVSHILHVQSDTSPPALWGRRDTRYFSPIIPSVIRGAPNTTQVSCLCSVVFNLNYKAIITAWTLGCQQWSPGLICSESIKPSSALEDFLFFFNQVILILPYLIFIIMLVPSLMEWKFSTSRSFTWSRLNI